MSLKILEEEEEEEEEVREGERKIKTIGKTGID